MGLSLRVETYKHLTDFVQFLARVNIRDYKIFFCKEKYLEEFCNDTFLIIMDVLQYDNGTVMFFPNELEHCLYQEILRSLIFFEDSAKFKKIEYVKNGVVYTQN